MNQILLGMMVASKSDEKWMDAERVYAFLDAMLGKNRWLLIYGSAEKSPDDIKDYCDRLRRLRVEVIITVAGLNPVIGRVVAAEFGIDHVLTETTVMCVPEKETAVTNLLDAPEFVALTCPGWGKRGMFNACFEACKRLAAYDHEILARLDKYFDEALKDKQPQFDVRGALAEEEDATADQTQRAEISGGE